MVLSELLCLYNRPDILGKLSLPFSSGLETQLDSEYSIRLLISLLSWYLLLSGNKGHCWAVTPFVSGYSSQADDLVGGLSSLPRAIHVPADNLLHHCPFSHQDLAFSLFLRSRRLSWAMEGGSDEAQQSLTVGHLWADLCWVTVGCFLTGGSGSDGKESACKAGDLGLIPRLGRAPGEGNDNWL